MLCNIIKKTPINKDHNSILESSGHSFNGKTPALGAGDIGSNPVALNKSNAFIRYFLKGSLKTLHFFFVEQT